MSGVNVSQQLSLTRHTEIEMTEKTETTTETTTTATPTPATTPSAKWLAAIAPLAEELEMSADEVTKAIMDAKLVNKPSDKGAKAIADANSVSDADFAKAFPDVASGTLKSGVNAMRAAANPAPAAAAVPANPAAPMLQGVMGSPMGSFFVIPEAPGGDNFLEILASSKSLTVDPVTIRAAIGAQFTYNMGLTDIPEKLAKGIEDYADSIADPVGEKFFEVLKLVRERKYAEVNVDGRMVTQERKLKVLERLNALPGAVYKFHMVLTGWNEQTVALRARNPLGMLNPGAMQYPPIDQVMDASESVVEALRKVFGGMGVMVSKAMAYEGLRIMQVLETPDLHVMLGTPNKEIMLQKLGISLTRADVRLERSVAQYVTFVIGSLYKNTNLPAGQEGVALEALYNLGQQIMPWMTNVGTSTRGTNGDGRRDGTPRGPMPMPGDRVGR